MIQIKRRRRRCWLRRTSSPSKTKDQVSFQRKQLIRVEQKIWLSNQTINFYFSAGTETEVLATLSSLANMEDGEMLKRDIAMSLEEQ